MLNWDDFRIFFAVASSRSFSSAGQRVRMDATTVTRRIERLEADLKVNLFSRSRRGLQLTAAGLRLAESGAGVEASINLARNKASANAAAGTVRISVPEGFGTSFLTPTAVDFLARRPGLDLEIVMNAGFLSPSTREVDVSITSDPPSSMRLLVEPLSDYEIGIYGSRKYLQRNGCPETPDELAAHPFVGFVEDLLYTPTLRYLNGVIPEISCRMRSSSVHAQIVMVKSGAGLGAFPHFLVQDDVDMVRVVPELEMVRTYWLSSHRELSDVGRLRAVRHWLFSIAEANKDRLVPSSRTSPVVATPKSLKIN